MAPTASPSPESSSQRHQKRLVMAFGLVAGFMLVETTAGLLTGSLALLSDAGHMATDAVALGMAVAAVAASRRPWHANATFGAYRLEILAALANAFLLLGVAGWVMVEAVARLRHPQPVELVPMLIVALCGLAVNVVAWLLLRPGARESLTLEGASTEVLADMAGSVGAIAAGVTVAATGWSQADAVFGGLIGLFILPRGWRLGGKALRVLMQAAPRHLDIAEVRRALAGLPGVVDVHDLHIWTLTSDMEVASAHVMIRSPQDPHATLDQARTLLVDRFGISHATLQVEPETHQGCQEVRW